MALTINSSGIDKALKNVENINKSINRISNSTERNMAMFEKRLKTSETLMSRMAKSASSISTSIKLASVAFSSMLLNKAVSSFTSAMAEYGSAGAMFRSSANKSDSLSDKALSRALELATGDEQKGLQNSLGKMAADAMVAGSDAQSLLLQAGFDPAEFAKMSQLDRLKTLIESFNKMGDNVAFREMFEKISGMSGSELEALSKLMPDIEKQFNELSKTMKGVDPNALAATDTAWKKLTYSFEDFMAVLSSKAAPHITKAFETIQKYILEFVESGGIEKTIQWLKDSLKYIVALLEPGSTMSKIFNIIGILWDGLVESGKLLVNIFKLIGNSFMLLVDRMQLFFENIKLLIFKALDSIPGLDYSKEISSSESSLSAIRQSVEGREADVMNNINNIKNNYANQFANSSKLFGELGATEISDTAKKIEVFIRNSDTYTQLSNPVIKQVGN